MATCQEWEDGFHFYECHEILDVILVTVMHFSCFKNPEPEIARSARAGSLSRHSHAFSSLEKSGTKPLEEAVEQADELLEDGAVMGELDGPEEESTEDEAEMEGQESEGRKTSAAVAEGN